MTLSECLERYANRPLASPMQIHPQATPVYELGIQDGITILAQELLEKLKQEQEQESE
jgi:hypothetical protein